MAYRPTPARTNAPSQLLSISSILTATGGSTNTGPSGSVTIINPPTAGSAGIALAVTGSVSPAGTAVRVGLSTSSSVSPTSWTSASINGTGWTATVTPSASGTYYVWAEQSNTTSLKAVGPAVTVSSSCSGSISITNPPSSGTPGTALSLTGTVSASGTAVQVGLSTSATVAPTTWITATVSGTGWTASVVEATAGTYYIWAEQTNATSIRSVSTAVVIASSGGSALSYSLISGSGNNSLSGTTLVTVTTQIYSPAPAVDWSSTIAAGAVDVQPNVYISALGSVTSCNFWFDSSATSVTIPATFGNNASRSNGVITFYPFSAGYGTPTAVPATPSTAGTYYGKYAFYNSGNTLLGVFVTSAITIA